MKDSDWEILNELYKNPNMTKVATVLFMTQPSLTKRIHHMEEEFGVDIVERNPKGLSFTPEGRYLCQQAEKYLEFLKKTKDEIEKMHNDTITTITLGVSYTYNKYSLSDFLIQYREEHPQVNFNIINEQSDGLYRLMLEDKIDVGFVRGDYAGEINKLLVANNPAYLVTKEPVEFNQLPNMEYLGYKTNSHTKNVFANWWKEWIGGEFPNGAVVGYVDVAWKLIAKGKGYTFCFLPDNFVNDYKLCFTPLTQKDGTVITRNTWCIYSKNKRIPDTLDEFIRCVNDQLVRK